MNVLVILGHPRTDSFCGALADAYRDGAREAEVAVRELALGELSFDPDVTEPCPSEQKLEPDLIEAQASIRWADHLAFVYPNWWGTMPARLKGFFDRVFTPGFAFAEYDEGAGAGHRKLLSETTAELIVTMDVPPLVYRLVQRKPGHNAIERATLGYVGVRTTRVTEIGPVEKSTPDEREAWLAKAERLGRSLETGPESRGQRLRRTAAAWLRALRPQFYPMAWVAYTVGALAATGSSALATRTYWAGLLFLVFLEAATVLSNEYLDYETDRENDFAGPFTGGSRVLVEDDLSFRALRFGIGTVLALAGAFGLAAAAWSAGSTAVAAGLVFGLTALALGYTVPPLRLSYRTLGELDVALTHGPAVLLAGFVLLGGSITDHLPWLLGLPLFLSILPSITLAGVPDVAADRSAGKQTLAARFGVETAGLIAGTTALAAAAIGIRWVALDAVPGYGPAILLAVPHALGLCWLLADRLRDASGPRRIDTLLLTALSYQVWFGVVPLVALW